MFISSSNDKLFENYQVHFGAQRKGRVHVSIYKISETVSPRIILQTGNFPYLCLGLFPPENDKLFENFQLHSGAHIKRGVSIYILEAVHHALHYKQGIFHISLYILRDCHHTLHYTEEN